MKKKKKKKEKDVQGDLGAEVADPHDGVPVSEAGVSDV